MTGITPSHPTAEVRRQHDQYHVTHEQFVRRALFSGLILLFIWAISSVVVAPYHAPIAAPASCYQQGC